MQVTATNTTVDALRTAVDASGFEAVIQESGTDAYLLRLSPVTEEEHQAILAAVRSVAPEAQEDKFDTGLDRALRCLGIPQGVRPGSFMEVWYRHDGGSLS